MIIESIDALERAATEAIAAGMETLHVELRTLAIIAVVDEIKGRAPKNYSALIRDDAVDQLKGIAERLDQIAQRLEQQVATLIAVTPTLSTPTPGTGKVC